MGRTVSCLLINSCICNCNVVGLELIFLLFLLVQNPHLSISDPIFTVGQGRQSNLVLKDPTVGNVLCKLSHIEVEFSLLL
jgi:hypothetical protein